MNSLKKIFTEDHEPTVERVFNSFNGPFHYKTGNSEDGNFDNNEVPSLKMRYMIDDYDELFGAGSREM